MSHTKVTAIKKIIAIKLVKYYLKNYCLKIIEAHFRPSPRNSLSVTKK